MKIREIITESISHSNAEKIISEFLKFVKNFLELDELPKINLIKDSDYSIKYRDIEKFYGHTLKNIMELV